MLRGVCLQIRSDRRRPVAVFRVRLQGSLIVAAVFRIYAEMPIDVNVQPVAEALRQAAELAGCATPRMEMYWRGKGEDSVEVLLWCPETLKEAPRDTEETTTRGDRPTQP